MKLTEADVEKAAVQWLEKLISGEIRVPEAEEAIEEIVSCL